jgi:hypothetical protein
MPERWYVRNGSALLHNLKHCGIYSPLENLLTCWHLVQNNNQHCPLKCTNINWGVTLQEYFETARNLFAIVQEQIFYWDYNCFYWLHNCSATSECKGQGAGSS